MTRSDLSNRFVRLTKNLPTFHGVPEQADVYSLFDQAMSVIAQRCHFYEPQISFTLTAGTATYRLDGSAFGRRIVRPYAIRLNGANLLDPVGRVGLWSVSDFERTYPNFADASQGTPTLAAWYGTTIRLFNTPSSAFTATASAYVAGEYIPGWVSGSKYYSTASAATASSEPDLPVEYHELVADLAVQLSTMPVAATEQAWAIVQGRNAHIASQLKSLANRNRESTSSTPYRFSEPPIYLSTDW